MFPSAVIPPPHTRTYKPTHTHTADWGLTVNVNAVLETYYHRQQKDPRCGRDHLSQCTVRLLAERSRAASLPCLPAFLAGSRWPACSLILPVHAQTTHTRALTHSHTRGGEEKRTAAPADATATDRPTSSTRCRELRPERGGENKTEVAAAQTTRLLISSYKHAPWGPFRLTFAPLELKSISLN